MRWACHRDAAEATKAVMGRVVVDINDIAVTVTRLSYNR